MIRRKGLILGVAIGLLMTVEIGSARADHTRRNNGTFGGTFLSTRMDLNDDGVLAVWSTSAVNGTLGKRTSQAVVEVIDPAGPPPTCPTTEVILDVPNGIGFSTLTATFPNGDQIYSRILTRKQCSLGGGQVQIDDVQEILGGTGKFEGASGMAELHTISRCQAVDGNAVPPQCFGSFTGEFEGTITLP